MFRNCVLKPNVSTVKWLKATGVRCIKTMAQTALGFVIVGKGIYEINWKYAIGVTAVAGVASLLTSVAGIPEVEGE